LLDSRHNKRRTSGRTKTSPWSLGATWDKRTGQGKEKAAPPPGQKVEIMKNGKVKSGALSPQNGNRIKSDEGTIVRIWGLKKNGPWSKKRRTKSI